MNSSSTPTSEISFISLSAEHFPLIHGWFNEPHVQAFYSLRIWTLEEVRKKLTPNLQGVGDLKGYIIFILKMPVGYIQCYPVKKHPWDNQDLAREIIEESAGIDLFIGEKKFIGKGMGRQILNAFLTAYIWPYYRYCLADPDIHNEGSLRLFRNCGFKEYKQINSKDALQRPVILQLFLKECEDFLAKTTPLGVSCEI